MIAVKFIYYICSTPIALYPSGIDYQQFDTSTMYYGEAFWILEGLVIVCTVNCFMVAVEEPRGYKILLAGSSPDRRTDIYDSLTDSWKRTGDLPLRTNLRYEATYSDNVIYFTTSEPFMILGIICERHHG